MANSKADAIRLVLCDIDGTLYDWDRILSPRTIADINRLHEEGYAFGIASGRPYEELIHYAEDWGFPFRLTSSSDSTARNCTSSAPGNCIPITSFPERR